MSQSFYGTLGAIATKITKHSYAVNQIVGWLQGLQLAWAHAIYVLVGFTGPLQRLD